MKTADWKDTSVGKIVAENFAAAKVFKKYGIDFCCHGETQLHEACAALKLDVEEVIQALQHQDSDGKGAIPFAGKNGADCYSKNGHAVTVLTVQS